MRNQAIAPMYTLESQLDLVRNRPTGFDYIKLILALSIIVWHSVTICYGPSAEAYFRTGPPRPIIALPLPSFSRSVASWLQAVLSGIKFLSFLRCG
jgi:hypothetical protein